MPVRRKQPAAAVFAAADTFIDVLKAIDRSMTWASEAACKDSDLDFIASSSLSHDYAGAVVGPLGVCNGCGVRRECLTYALEGGREVVGVWGGTTTRERFRELPRRTGEFTPRLTQSELTSLVEEFEARFEDGLAGWRRKAGRKGEGRDPPRGGLALPPSPNPCSRTWVHKAAEERM